MNLDLRETMDSEENCPSLARSDSGKGDSLDAAEYSGENNLPKGNSKRGDSSEISNEIADLAQKFSNKDNVVKSYENPSPSREKVDVGMLNDPDSDIGRSSVSKHLTVSQNGCGRSILQLTHSLQDQNEPSSHQREYCQNKLKHNIDEHVSFPTNGENTFQNHVNGCTSMKTCASCGAQCLKCKRQFAIDCPPLDLNSFNNDKSLKGYAEGSYSASPDMSNLTSPYSCNKSCQDIDSTCPDNVTQQNGHSKQCSAIPYRTTHSTEQTYLPISPQGMVAKNTMDQLTREFILTKNKLSESQHITSHMHLRNDQLKRENSQVCETMLAHAELQIQTCLQSMAVLQKHAAWWENKYYKTKEKLGVKQEFQAKEHELTRKQYELEAKHWELESKQRELKGKQHELNDKERDLDDKQHELANKQQDLDYKQHELDYKQRDLDSRQNELDSLHKECDKLKEENEDLTKTVNWLKEEQKKREEEEDKPEEEPELRAALNVRPPSANLDQTQVKSPYTGN